jgi:ribosomal protein L7/L12
MPELSVDPPVYSVVLTGAQDNALRLMAEVRALRPDLSPKEVKQLVQNPPQTLKENLDWLEATKLARHLRNFDAVVEIRDIHDEYVFENYRELKTPRPYPG